MIPVVGVFRSQPEAARGAAQLRAAGIPEGTINMLTPRPGEKEVARVARVDGEQPGMVKAIGAVAGGAVGLGVGEALATLVVPGLGPVLAVGVAGGALLGALAGGTLGGAAENAIFSGLPGDELFVYEDALRQGRTVLVTMAQDKKQAEMARAVLENAGAESIDRAREMWWLGLRDVEKEHYEAHGGNFREDESSFRRGFAAALLRENRDKSYEQCRAELSARRTEGCDSEAFRAGYERGRKYAESHKTRAE